MSGLCAFFSSKLCLWDLSTLFCVAVMFSLNMKWNVSYSAICRMPSSLVLFFQTGGWSNSIGSYLQSAHSRMWHGLELQNPWNTKTLNNIETFPAPISNFDIITPKHPSGQNTSHSLLEGIQSLLIRVLVFDNSGPLYHPLQPPRQPLLRGTLGWVCHLVAAPEIRHFTSLSSVGLYHELPFSFALLLCWARPSISFSNMSIYYSLTSFPHPISYAVLTLLS